MSAHLPLRPPAPIDAAQPYEFVIPSSAAGLRLDQFLAAQELPFSRSQLARRIAEGEVRLDGQPSKPGQRLRAGQRVVFAPPPPAPVGLQPEPIPLDILFEDRHLIVLHKPAGMVVHPAPGHPSGTLVNALLHHCGRLPAAPAYRAEGPPVPDGSDELETDDEADPVEPASAPSQLSIGGQQRPGIVHRIDQGTSGVLVCAKDEPTLVGLQAQFQRHSITRRYLAIVEGTPAAQGTFATRYGRHPSDRKRFTGRSGGKRAVTHYRVLEPLPCGPAALVEVSLETGRTHQIRVHFSEAGFPLVGDPLYGQQGPTRNQPLRAARAALSRQALHAAVLGFMHPLTQRWLEFSVPAPTDFEQGLLLLRGSALRPAPQPPAGGGA